MNERSYDIQELVAESGTPRRTIHFYTQQGILPPPQGAGLAARYGEEHLLRLRLIPLLRRRGMRLDQIRAEFARLDAAGMKALLDESPIPLSVPQPTPSPALPTGQASVRYDLGDGIVLYAPAHLSLAGQARLSRILRAAFARRFPVMPMNGAKSAADGATEDEEA
ncbi:MAG: MerR family transcriptional regulator [Anaerolineaceae bacterium]|nr:MerR family transcriptional regulator [Anaerolineaceae bacterium]